MSQAKISIWLQNQQEPYSSLESAIIDHDEQWSSSNENKPIEWEERPATVERIVESAKGKNMSQRNSSLDSPEIANRKVTAEGHERREGQSAGRETGTKRPALAEASHNFDRRANARTSKRSNVSNTQMRKTRKRVFPKNKTVRCPNCKTKIKDLLSSSKPNPSSTKGKEMRKEIPSSTQPTQSSAQTPLITSASQELPPITPAPPAKKSKIADTEGERAAEPSSSRSSQYSPWKYLYDGPHIATYRRW